MGAAGPSYGRKAAGLLLAVVSLAIAVTTFNGLEWPPDFPGWWPLALFGAFTSLLAGVWAYRIWTHRSSTALRILSWLSLLGSLAMAPFFAMLVWCVATWC